MLQCLDTVMMSAQHARRAWVEVSIALGLQSTRGRTESEVADELGVSRQAVSKDVTRFLRITGLSPAFRSEVGRGPAVVQGMSHLGRATY